MNSSTKIVSACPANEECIIPEATNIFQDKVAGTASCTAVAVTVTKADLNADCTTAADCKSNNCGGGKCAQGTRGQNSICQYDDECLSTMCEGQRCLAKKEIHQKCQTNFQCSSNNCSNNVCVKADGEACASNEECASFLCNSTCQSLALLQNSTCLGKEDDCKGDLNCLTSETTSLDKFCLSPLALNQKCSSSSQCGSNLYCLGGNNGKCVTRKAQDQACVNGQQCQSGYCQGSKCISKLETNAVCTTDSQCGHGNFCQDYNTCSSTNVNDACTIDRECPVNHHCLDSICVVNKASNINCTDDSQCEDTLYCSPGSQRKCIARAVLNGSCAGNIKCLKSLYCNGTKCINDTTNCKQGQHQSCGSNKYCGSDSLCKDRVANGGSCSATQLCVATDFCNSSNLCQALKTTGCENSNQCNINNKCIPKHCQPLLAFDAACVNNTDCQSGNCNETSNKCQNGSSDPNSSCTANTDCSTNLCTTKQNVKKCLKYKDENQSCTLDTDCGPGMICINNICTYMLSLDNSQAATNALQCKTNNLNSSSQCAEVTLQVDGTQKSYPYKCQSTCTYSGLASGTSILQCLDTNGFCEIKVGMTQYTNYYKQLVTFYKLTDIKNDLNKSARRLIDPFEIFKYVESYTNSDVQTKISALKDQFIKLSYTNIIYNNCNLTCLPKSPSFFDPLRLTKQFKFCQSQSKRVSCEQISTPTNCAKLTLETSGTLQVKFYNHSAPTLKKCTVIEQPNQLNVNQFGYSHTFTFGSYNQVTASNEGGIGQKCKPNNDCDQGKCSGTCTTGNKPLYSECRYQGQCLSTSFCWLGRDKCQTATSNISNICQDDDECASGYYCDSSSNKCLAQKNVNQACANDNECLTANFCNSTQKCQARKIAASNCSKVRECQDSLFCQSGNCIARAQNNQACSSHQQCSLASYCLSQNPSSALTCGSSTCSSGQYCHSSSTCIARIATGQTCTKDQQECEQGSRCAQDSVSTCQTGIADSESCTADKDCLNKKCNSLVCATVTSCSADSDCPYGKYCNTPGTECVNKKVNTNACTRNLECNSNYCHTLVCYDDAAKQPQDGACATNSDCRPNLYCSSLKCKPLLSENANCQASQNSCSAGLSCKFAYKCRVLVQSSDICHNTTNDCPSNFYCNTSNNRCVQKKSCLTNSSQTCENKCQAKKAIGATGCNSNDQCNDQSICASNTCTSKKSLNEDCLSARCKSGLFCHKKTNTGYCINRIADGATCHLSSQTHQSNLQEKICSSQNFRCKSNTCTTTTQNTGALQSCTSSRCIESTQFCNNNTCENYKTSSCNLDQQCPSSKYCSNNQCLDRLTQDSNSCTSIQCSVEQYCLNPTCKYVPNGGVCSKDSECEKSDYCDGANCQNRKQQNQPCTKTEQCNPGMQCANIGGSNFCKQFYSINSGTLGTTKTCQNGRVNTGTNACSKQLKIKSQSSVLAYPYHCKTGQKCEYYQQGITTAVQTLDCSKLNYSSGDGHCPIIAGVLEYNNYIDNLKKLIPSDKITACDRATQGSGEISVELDQCSTATPQQKKDAWGNYFFFRYFNLIYFDQIRNCTMAIVSNDQKLRDKSYLPQYVIPSLEKSTIYTKIGNNTNSEVIENVLQQFINSNTNGLTGIIDNRLIFKERMEQIIQLPNINAFLPQIKTSLQLGMKSSTDGSQIQTFIGLVDKLIEKNERDSNSTFLQFGTFHLNQVSPPYRSVTTQPIVDISMDQATKAELKQKLITQLNYQLWVSNPIHDFPAGQSIPNVLVILDPKNKTNEIVDSGVINNSVNFKITSTVPIKNSKCGRFDNSTNTWIQTNILTTKLQSHIIQCKVSHFSTFSLSYLEPIVDYKVELKLIGQVVTIFVIFLLIIVMLHYLIDKRYDRISKKSFFMLQNRFAQHCHRVKSKMFKQEISKNQKIVLKNNQGENSFQQPYPQICGPTVEIELNQLDTQKPRTLLPIITKIIPHYNLFNSFSCCKLWWYNILALTPFLNAFTRRNPQLTRKCQFITDFVRLLLLLAISIAIASQSDSLDTNLYIVTGTFLMIPINLYELCSTHKERRSSMSISHYTRQLLAKLPDDKTLGKKHPRNKEELLELKIAMYDWMPREKTRIRGIVMMTIYSILYLASVVLLLIYSKKCIEGEEDRLMKGIAGFFIGLGAGLGICQVTILMSVFSKAYVFRARKRGRCGRLVESFFTDLRTCVIFNDYRALAFKFQDKSKQKLSNNEEKYRLTFT